MEKTKKMISTRKLYSKHPFADQNTQQIECLCLAGQRTILLIRGKEMENNCKRKQNYMTRKSQSQIVQQLPTSDNEENFLQKNEIE